MPFWGIFADPRSIMERGIAREIIDGKLYNRKSRYLMQKRFTPNVPSQAVEATPEFVLKRHK